MLLSIIIVNYKTPHLVLKCVKSVKDTIDFKLDYEIIVVDNNSQDESEQIVKKAFDDIIWINKSDNDGFGRANNVGINNSKGEFVLLLNSDVVVCTNTINECLKKIESNQKTGILGCKLLNDDGSSQKSVYYHFADLKSQFEKNLFFDYFFKFKKTNIRAIMGSFMLIPKHVLIETGLFDPDFFMYSEEIELCNRIIMQGYKLEYFDAVYAYHKHGASSKNPIWEQNQRMLSNALLILKLNGYFIYIIYFLISILNSAVNFVLMWFLDKNFRKEYLEGEKIFYRNFHYYILIPFLFSKSIGNGKRILRRA